MAAREPRGRRSRASTSRYRPQLGGRLVNALLGVATAGVLASGVVAFAVPTRWAAAATTIHGVLAVLLVLLAPAKLRGPVRAGFARGRPTRWLSTLFGVVVLGAFTLGLLHGLGLWYGIGPWSALWTHTLLGVVAIPLLVWHTLSRPARVRATDLSRRAVLRVGVLAGAAATLRAVQDPVAGAVGLAGPRRRTTGSYQTASFDPARMPRVIWLDDVRPTDTAAERWRLVVAGTRVPVAALRRQARPVVATLDCTGGWFSEQSWDAVPLAALVPSDHGGARSVRVTSATGYARRFALDRLDRLHLAIGYGGQPLLPGHGAPVRLVVPGRRGPEWVKWVAEVALDARPPWLEPPLPVT